MGLGIEGIERNDFLCEVYIRESTKFLGQVDSFLDFGTNGSTRFGASGANTMCSLAMTSRGLSALVLFLDGQAGDRLPFSSQR